MIPGKGERIATVGVICGIVISLPVAPTINVMLHGVHPIEPFVFLAVPAPLLGIALLASYMPARMSADKGPLVL